MTEKKVFLFFFFTFHHELFLFLFHLLSTFGVTSRLTLNPQHMHLFQLLSLKSMGSIIPGLMDFAAEVRMKHFNHGRA